MTMADIVRPEDVLSDAVNTVTVNGIDVRKGTVAAFVANVKLLESLPPANPDRQPIEAQLRALAPALNAMGVLDVFAPRSPEVAALLGQPG
jgi:hypothetical protein